MECAITQSLILPIQMSPCRVIILVAASHVIAAEMIAVLQALHNHMILFCLIFQIQVDI